MRADPARDAGDRADHSPRAARPRSGLPSAPSRRRAGCMPSALFTPRGELLVLREDVGRHNALDKVIGSQVLAGRLPLNDTVLMVSGRVSFELVQKAAVAGIPILCRGVGPVRPRDPGSGTAGRHARRLPPRRRLQRVQPRRQDRSPGPGGLGVGSRSCPRDLIFPGGLATVPIPAGGGASSRSSGGRHVQGSSRAIRVPVRVEPRVWPTSKRGARVPLGSGAHGPRARGIPRRISDAHTRA